LPFKLILLASLLIETLIFSILPLPLSNFLKESVRDRFLSIANAFAGGLFLSAGFIHLLGETNEILEQELSGSLPFALFFSSLGFLGAFFFEKVLFANYHTHQHEEKQPLTKNVETPQNYGTSGNKHKNDNEEHKEYVSSHPWVPYILMVVLSAHSLISGIALGVQQSVDSALPLFIAIVSHKWIEAMAIAVSLIRMELRRKRFFCID